MRRLIHNQVGLTLVELLVAMVIGMIVSAGAYSVFFSTTRTARKQEQVSEIQQNLRVAMERITQDIRQAGFGIPEDGSSLSFSNGSWSAPITVTNSNSAPDEITLLGVGYKIGMTSGYNGALLMINPDFNGDDQFSGFMETRYVAASSDESGALEDTGTTSWDHKFLQGGTTFRTDRRHLSIGGIEYVVATDYAVNGNNIAITADISNDPYANNIPVYFLQSIRYLIEGCYDEDGDGSFYPADSDESDFLCLKSEDSTGLRGNGERVVAEGIEDIQFAYGVDVSPRDGKVDYPASGYNSAAFVSDPADDSSIVAVRINIVARSRVRDQYDKSTRPAFEDRPAGTEDSYSRRTLTKTIKLRNPRSGA